MQCNGLKKKQMFERKNNVNIYSKLLKNTHNVINKRIIRYYTLHDITSWDQNNKPMKNLLNAMFYLSDNVAYVNIFCG